VFLAVVACGNRANGLAASGSSSGTSGGASKGTASGTSAGVSTGASAGVPSTGAGSGAGAGGTGSSGMGGTSGSSGTGSSGMSGTTIPVPTPFVNYELTGTWPTLIATTAAGPIKQTPGALTYKMVQVHDQFLAESCAIADYDHDGIPDISSGRRWYQGPDFQTAHIFRGTPFATPGHGVLPTTGASIELYNGASDDAADYPFDVDGDGWTDIINIAPTEARTPINPEPRPQENASGSWYKNPGMPAAAGDVAWTPHLIHSDIRHEQHGLVDVDGDGKPEIFGACKGCSPYQTKGYYQADWGNPTAPWTFHPVTRAYVFPFGGTGHMHGLGFGDVNGDGRPDLLERSGVWLQPATFLDAGVWGGAGPLFAGSFVPTAFSVPPQVADNVGNHGGSHMFAYDVDGDGLTDVVSADWAHGWGLSWYQQMPPGVASCLGATTTATTASPNCFVHHPIINTNSAADLAAYGNVAFSELHAAQFVDMDGDGLPDIVTGKEWLAQPYDQGDPDNHGTPVLYVFKLVRDANPPQAGKAHFEPHLVNAAIITADAGTPTDSGPPASTWVGGSGIGTQVTVGQINPQTDGIMDICIASKLGLFVYLGQ
jgi:hypothetical protein